MMNGWSIKRDKISLPVGRLWEIISALRWVGWGGEASDTVKGGRDRENMSSYECRARDGGKSILCKPAVPPSALWYSAQLFRGGWGRGGLEQNEAYSHVVTTHSPLRVHTSLTCFGTSVTSVCPFINPPHRLQTTVLLPIDSLVSARECHHLWTAREMDQPQYNLSSVPAISLDSHCLPGAFWYEILIRSADVSPVFPLTCTVSVL